LPASWRRRWQERLGNPLPDRLHDPDRPYAEIPRRPEIERHNRNQAVNMLDAVSKIWM